MSIDWNKVYACSWRSKDVSLRVIQALDLIELDHLHGIDTQKKALLENTARFLEGLPANNALLWGSRGTGKSSLVKAVFNHYKDQGLRVIELNKTDLADLPEIVDPIRGLPQKFIIFCDDFSFNLSDHSYISLKTILEGSFEKPPENVLIYTTSNRRHLLPEPLKENLDTKVVDGEIHYSDAVEERISLSDRFGLWLSFYATDLKNYLQLVDYYFPNITSEKRQEIHRAAKHYANLRSSHSGRTAKQFYQYYNKP